MKRDEHPHRELLEQYLLGLTTRERADEVERLLESDPTAKQELERLSKQLNDYIAGQGMGTAAGPSPRRALEDFHDLDHEMITQMTKRNHALVIWRLALSAVCLALLFISGYLFRQNQNYRLEINKEKALHAQDEVSHKRQIEELRGRDVAWDSLSTRTIPSGRGNVLLHRVAGDEVAFLDISHLDSLLNEEAYHLLLLEEAPDGRITPHQLVVLDSARSTLLPLPEQTREINLWRGASSYEVPRDSALLEFVTRQDATFLRTTRKSKL